MIDWEDVVIHGAVALLSVVVMLVALSWLMEPRLVLVAMGVANLIFWPAREMLQDLRKGHRWPRVWPLRRSTQKDWEAGVPMLIGLLAVIYGLTGAV